VVEGKKESSLILEFATTRLSPLTPEIRGSIGAGPSTLYLLNWKAGKGGSTSQVSVPQNSLLIC